MRIATIAGLAAIGVLVLGTLSCLLEEEPEDLPVARASVRTREALLADSVKNATQDLVALSAQVDRVRQLLAAVRARASKADANAALGTGGTGESEPGVPAADAEKFMQERVEKLRGEVATWSAEIMALIDKKK